MIKSNFYITESEKKKILENHIQATKKLYLKEEVVEDETIEKIEIEKPEFYTKLRDLFKKVLIKNQLSTKDGWID